MRNKSNTGTERKLAEASTHLFPSKFSPEFYDGSASAITLSLKQLQNLGSNLYCFHSQP